MTNFHVGQKVTLAKDFPKGEISRAKKCGVILPAAGVVYTIRAVEPGVFSKRDTYLLLAELVNAPMSSGREPNFFSKLFRPVVERKTSIAIFHEILNKTRTGVPA
jgi:hypothetical protein